MIEGAREGASYLLSMFENGDDITHHLDTHISKDLLETTKHTNVMQSCICTCFNKR